MNQLDPRATEPRRRRLSNVGLPPPVAKSGLETVLHSALNERDDTALAEAMRRMRPVMIRLAMDHVHSLDDAEDLIQETWMAALRGIRRFQGRALLSTWILRILSYRARTMGKRAARSIPVSWAAAGAGDGWDSSAVPFFGQRPEQTDDGVGVRELHEALSVAMARLPPKQREVFSLRALEGRSAEDVCDRLGVSAGNQRVLLHRARSQVQRRLSVYSGRASRSPDGDSDSHGCRGFPAMGAMVCTWEFHAWSGRLFPREMSDTGHLN
jgi:RNA polymerase sigma-70 factor (ECF subfamily)